MLFAAADKESVSTGEIEFRISASASGPSWTHRTRSSLGAGEFHQQIAVLTVEASLLAATAARSLAPFSATPRSSWRHCLPPRAPRSASASAADRRKVLSRAARLRSFRRSAREAASFDLGIAGGARLQRSTLSAATAPPVRLAWSPLPRRISPRWRRHRCDIMRTSPKSWPHASSGQ